MECSAPTSSHVGDQSSKANSIANAAPNDLRCSFHVKVVDLRLMNCIYSVDICNATGAVTGLDIFNIPYLGVKSFS